MKRLECTSPTSMPAADVSIAHLLIHPTIPLPRPGPRRPPGTTDWCSSTATAGWQWQAAVAGARAPFGLQLGPVAPGLLWPAAATQGRQRWFPSQRTNFCHAGEEEEQRNRGSPSAVGGAAAPPFHMGSSASGMDDFPVS